jgi:hypothetical protein
MQTYSGPRCKCVAAGAAFTVLFAAIIIILVSVLMCCAGIIDDCQCSCGASLSDHCVGPMIAAWLLLVFTVWITICIVRYGTICRAEE